VITRTIPAEMIDRAHQANILAVLDMRAVRTKKISAVERAGPCPRCGGTDRFAINVTEQVFNCRGCGVGRDAIALVQFLDGCSFSEAVERLIGGSWRPSERPEVFIAANLEKAAPEPPNERLALLWQNRILLTTRRR
jgi:DNA primase